MRTPTPDPEFMFAPIVPATESRQQDSLLNIIQDNDVDVQPLLDSVIPHKTVKGILRYTLARCLCPYMLLVYTVCKKKLTKFVIV